MKLIPQQPAPRIVPHDIDQTDRTHDEYTDDRAPHPFIVGSESGIGDVQHAVGTKNAGERDDTGIVAATAPQHSKKLRVIPLDDPTEVPNQILAEWNDYYIDIMESAHLERAGKVSVAQAKRNAAYWVLDQGLGEVSSNFREDLVEHPLAIFSGQALLDDLIGPLKIFESRKRTASVSMSDDTEGRSQSSKRVRSRLGEQKSPAQTEHQGDLEVLANDQEISFAEDETETEVGRQRQTPLSDHLSDVPWNIYASSRQGSVRPGTSIAGASSSAGGRGTFSVNIASSNVKRVSQLIGESPLDRRRRLAHSSVFGGSSNRDDADHGSVGGDFNIDDVDLHAQLAASRDEEFELYGPGANVSTQEAGTSQWVSDVLEREAFNFLEFLQATIEKKQELLDTGTDEEGNATTTFEDLLPPVNNSRVVAAQGLLHVLSLATQGVVGVKQYEAFGAIELSITSDIKSRD